jgi:hypothetical protein
VTATLLTASDPLSRTGATDTTVPVKISAALRATCCTSKGTIGVEIGFG